jgi:hypothetical protein
VVVTRREIRSATKGRDRELASFDEMVERAIAEGWIRVDPDGFVPGESRPA